MTKAEITREADGLYARLHPRRTYTMRRAVATDMLARLPGGELWHNGSRYQPKISSIGGGVVVLWFVERV